MVATMIETNTRTESATITHTLIPHTSCFEPVSGAKYCYSPLVSRVLFSLKLNLDLAVRIFHFWKTRF
jgi:hypothetical protein